MAINGQVGNPTNLSDQDGSSVLSFEELGHGGVNDYLPNRKGYFFIGGEDISSSVSSLSIQTGLNQSDFLEIQLIGFIPATDGDDLQIQLYEDGVLETTGVYDVGKQYWKSSTASAFSHSSSDTNISLGNVGSASYEQWNGFLTLTDARNSSAQTKYMVQGGAIANDGLLTNYGRWGELPQASNVDGIKIFFGTGNITAGKVRIYGYE